MDSEKYVENASIPEPSIKKMEPHLVDATMPVLDIRRHYHGGQIRGALRYDPKKLLAADKLVLPLRKGGTIVLCADNDEVAESIATRLHDDGYGDAYVLDGGFDAWKERGLPVEEATQEQPIPGEEGAGIPRV